MPARPIETPILQRGFSTLDDSMSSVIDNEVESVIDSCQGSDDDGEMRMSDDAGSDGSSSLDLSLKRVSS